MLLKFHVQPLQPGLATPRPLHATMIAYHKILISEPCTVLEPPGGCALRWFLSTKSCANCSHWPLPVAQVDKPYLPITVLPSFSLVFPSAFRWSIFCSTQSALRISAIWVHEVTPAQMGSKGSNGLRVKQVAFLPVSSLNNTAPGLTPHPHCCRHHKRSKAIK